MRFYEFGVITASVIFLFLGTCCHLKVNFGAVIPLLEREFRVMFVSYDGFDETEDTVFPDMLNIQANCGGHIRAAYGRSLGGSFVGLLVCWESIRNRFYSDLVILRGMWMTAGIIS